jgi:hypothetical protein
MRTAAPVKPIPRKKERLDNAVTIRTSLPQKRFGRSYSNYKLLKLKTRVPKALKRSIDRGLIGIVLPAADGVAEELLDDTPLTTFVLGEVTAEFGRG